MGTIAAAAGRMYSYGEIQRDCDANADEQLMLRYQRGDEEAFRILYGRYKGRLFRFILRLTHDATTTEEVFQETWLGVISSRTRYRPEARFSTYLFGIAHNRVSDHWRKQRRSPRGVADGTDEPSDAEGETSRIGSPHATTMNSYLGDALLRALYELPDAQREAFLMKAEGGLSIEEISQLTGVGRETAKSRLRYAMERLRSALEAWR